MKILAFTMTLALFGMITYACTNVDAQRAKNAIDENSYRQELVDCKDKGKAAHDLSIYDICAAGVDLKYGVSDKAGPDQ